MAKKLKKKCWQFFQRTQTQFPSPTRQFINRLRNSSPKGSNALFGFLWHLVQTWYTDINAEKQPQNEIKQQQKNTLYYFQ